MGKIGLLALAGIVLVGGAFVMKIEDAPAPAAAPLRWDSAGLLDDASTRRMGSYVRWAGHDCDAVAAFHVVKNDRGEVFVARCADGAQWLVVDRDDGKQPDVASCAKVDPALGRCL